MKQRRKSVIFLSFLLLSGAQRSEALFCNRWGGGGEGSANDQMRKHTMLKDKAGGRVLGMEGRKRVERVFERLPCRFLV